MQRRQPEVARARGARRQQRALPVPGAPSTTTTRPSPDRRPRGRPRAWRSRRRVRAIAPANRKPQRGPVGGSRATERARPRSNAHPRRRRALDGGRPARPRGTAGPAPRREGRVPGARRIRRSAGAVSCPRRCSTTGRCCPPWERFGAEAQKLRCSYVSSRPDEGRTVAPRWRWWSRRRSEQRGDGGTAPGASGSHGPAVSGKHPELPARGLAGPVRRN